MTFATVFFRVHLLLIWAPKQAGDRFISPDGRLSRGGNYSDDERGGPGVHTHTHTPPLPTPPSDSQRPCSQPALHNPPSEGTRVALVTMSAAPPAPLSIRRDCTVH